MFGYYNNQIDFNYDIPFI